MRKRCLNCLVGIIVEKVRRFREGRILDWFIMWGQRTHHPTLFPKRTFDKGNKEGTDTGNTDNFELIGNFL